MFWWTQITLFSKSSTSDMPCTALHCTALLSAVTPYYLNPFIESATLLHRALVQLMLSLFLYFSYPSLPSPQPSHSSYPYPLLLLSPRFPFPYPCLFPYHFLNSPFRSLRVITSSHSATKTVQELSPKCLKYCTVLMLMSLPLTSPEQQQIRYETDRDTTLLSSERDLIRIILPGISRYQICYVK